MFIVDNIKTERIYTEEGYLITPAKLTKVGIFNYPLYKIRDGNVPDKYRNSDPNTIIRLFRMPEEVFKEESLLSLENKPITNNHPDEMVNSKNVTSVQVGFLSERPSIDGDFVIAKLVIQDQNTINDINDGKTQMSLGYLMDIDWTLGKDDRFGEYDGIQRNIRYNHIAVVSSGRAGPEVKIADGGKMLVDGVEVTEQMYIELRKENDTLKGQLDAEKVKVADALSKENINELVNKRLNVIDNAKKICTNVDVTKSDREIMCDAIALKGIEVTDNHSDDYVIGVFNTLVNTKSESLDFAKGKTVAVKDSRSEYVTRLKNAWRNK